VSALCPHFPDTSCFLATLVEVEPPFCTVFSPLKGKRFSSPLLHCFVSAFFADVTSAGFSIMMRTPLMTKVCPILPFYSVPYFFFPDKTRRLATFLLVANPPGIALKGLYILPLVFELFHPCFVSLAPIQNILYILSRKTFRSSPCAQIPPPTRPQRVVKTAFSGHLRFLPVRLRVQTSTSRSPHKTFPSCPSHDCLTILTNLLVSFPVHQFVPPFPFPYDSTPLIFHSRPQL